MKNHTYIGTSQFYKRALSIAIPVMAQLLIQNFVSLIDNFMVAGLGDIKMSGVNVAGQINFVFMILVNTICMSGGIFMSQFKGAGDREGMQQSFRFKIIFTGLCGIAYMTVCFIAPRGLFNVMVTINKDADAIITQSVLYSRAAAVSWLLMCMSQSIASSLREIELVKAPLVISVHRVLKLQEQHTLRLLHAQSNLFCSSDTVLQNDRASCSIRLNFCT